MRLSPTLTIYIGRSFLANFIAVFVVFLVIIFLFDTVELLRRFQSLIVALFYHSEDRPLE